MVLVRFTDKIFFFLGNVNKKHAGARYSNLRHNNKVFFSVLSKEMVYTKILTNLSIFYLHLIIVLN